MAKPGLRQGMLAGVIVLGLCGTALAADFSEGQRRFSLGDYAGAAEIWQVLAENGDVRAQYSLAALLSDPKSPIRDLAMAEKWATEAKNRDYVPAGALLGHIRSQFAANTPVTSTTKMAAAPKPKTVQPTPSQPMKQAAKPAAKPVAEKPVAKAAVKPAQPPLDEAAIAAAPSYDGPVPAPRQVAKAATKPAVKPATPTPVEVTPADVARLDPASPAKAVPATKVAAKDPHAEIRADVVAVLDSLAARSRRGTLSYGTIDIQGNAPQYDVNIADVAFAGHDGARFDVGTVTARVIDVDKRYRNVFVALPTHLPYTGGNGAGEIALGGQDIAIRWDRQLATSTEFHLRLYDVTATAEGADKPAVQFGEIGVVSDVHSDGERWDGPVAVAVKRARITRRNGGTFDLGDIALTATLRGFDLPQYMALANDDGSVLLPNGTLNAQMGDMLQGLQLSLQARDLAIDDPVQGRLQIDAVRQALVFSDLDQPLANLRVELAHDGLRDDRGSANHDMVPRRLDLAVNLANVPLLPVVQAGFTTGLEYALFGQIHTADETMAGLTQALNDAGFRITVERADFSTDKLDGQAAGTLSADAAAPGGLAGEIVLNIAGLLALLDPSGSRETTGAAHAGALTWLPLIASLGKPVDGGMAHEFRLSLLPDGQLGINGKPLSALLTPPETTE